MLALLLFAICALHAEAQMRPRDVFMAVQRSPSSSEARCMRWNCPCAGTTRQRHTLAKRFQESERFRGNIHHSNQLQRCSNQDNNVNCIRNYVGCHLTGLPSIDLMSSNNDKPQVIAHKLWSVLASLAVFVEQARKDERLFVVDEKDSFESAIVRIEEDHIYNMLCALQVRYSQDFPNMIKRPVMKSVMSEGCRLTNDRAAIDNRNYIVFHQLGRYLRYATKQFKKLSVIM